MRKDLHENDQEWLDFGTEVSLDKDKVLRCGWRSKESQLMRFEVLLGEIIDGDRILDVGCGTGDFYQYLKDSGLNFSYVGTDISPEILKIAESRYKKENARFVLMDILDLEPNYRWLSKSEVVVASGIFTMRKHRSLEYLDTMISRMMAVSNRVVAFNLLSTFSDEIKDSSRYYSPSEVIMLITRHTHKFKILHDYMPHDFTCVLYK